MYDPMSTMYEKILQRTDYGQMCTNHEFQSDFEVVRGISGVSNVITCIVSCI